MTFRRVDLGMIPAHLGSHQLRRRSRLRAVGRAGVPARAVRPDRGRRRAARSAAVRDARSDVAAAREELRDVVPRVPARSTPRPRAGSRAISSSITSSSAGRRTRPRRRPAARSAGSWRFVVEPDPDDPADVIGDEPVWHDGTVVGWITSGGYGHSRREVDRPGLRADRARRRPTDRAATASRSRSSAGVGRPGCSPNRCSTPPAAGCASDRSTGGAGRDRRGRADRRRWAAARVRAGRFGGGRDAAGGRDAGQRRDVVPRRRLRQLPRPGRRDRLCPDVPDGGPAGAGGRQPPAGGLPPLPVVRSTAVDGDAARGARSRSRGSRSMSRSSAAGRPGSRRPRRRSGRGSRCSSSTPAPGTRSSAIYAGPDRRRADRPAGMLHVHAREIVVATGAAELHPVVPGNDLRGLVTARRRRAAARGRCLARRRRSRSGRRAGGRPGDGRRRAARPVRGRRAVGSAPWSPPTTDRRRDDHPCRHGDPRSRAARRATCWRGWPARSPRPRGRRRGRRSSRSPRRPPRASSAAAWARPSTTSQAAWDKRLPGARAPQALQPGLSRHVPGRRLPAPRPLVDRRAGRAPSRPRSRPARRPARSPWPRRPPTRTVDAFRRTPLHDEHLALGARMDRFGGWWRPWHYGDPIAEYWAVREGVSLGDVSTLGQARRVRPGRGRGPRAALPVPRRGHQARALALRAAAQRARPRHGRRDDPARDRRPVRAERSRRVARPTPRCGSATGSRRGASASTSWTGRCRSPRSMSRGRSRRSCCERAGLPDPPRFLGHVHADDRRRPVPRHAPVVHRRGSVRAPPPGRSLGRAVAGADWTLGADLGIRPHGLQALFGLRLEKGHVIVGMDTEMDSTPRRLAWTGRCGWRSRGSSAGPRWSGPRSSPTSDAGWGSRCRDWRRPRARPIWAGGEIVGNVTGSWTSPLLGKAAHARLAEADAVRRSRRDRRPRGHRRTRPRSTIRRAAVPALEAAPASASWPIPRRSMPLVARRGPGPTIEPLALRAGRGAGHRCRPAVDLEDRARDRRRRRRASWRSCHG